MNNINDCTIQLSVFVAIIFMFCGLGSRVLLFLQTQPNPQYFGGSTQTAVELVEYKAKPQSSQHRSLLVVEKSTYHLPIHLVGWQHLFFPH